MKYEFLKVFADNKSIGQAYERCASAESMSDPKDCILRYYDRLICVIKGVYKTENLEAPIIHNPGVHAICTDADYMHVDSPFAAWLQNDEALAFCQELRKLRNNIVHCEGEYGASKADAINVGEQLELILELICSKIKLSVLE